MENISLVAIDLAKQSFHVRGVNHSGRAIIDRTVRREDLLDFVLKFPQRALISMEACASAHFWAREFIALGYEVRLIAPQFVKPFVKSQKNDRNDAEAIAEAACRPTMRFVPVKTESQQEILSVHRARQRLVKNCTALMNEIRGIIGEFGYAVRQGASALRKWFADLDAYELPVRLKLVLRDLFGELSQLEARIKEYNELLCEISQQEPACKRLLTIPGLGKISATALYATVGDPRQFKNGRSLAAWVGLVPRQKSTGGKAKLGSISKRGDRYLRQLLVHGARSVVKVAGKKADPYNLWATKLRKERGYNRAAVAVANRNARIAWALMVNPEATFSASHQPSPVLN